MKSTIKFLSLAFLLCFMTNNTFAVKAYPYPVEIIQPDGSNLTIILKGDERVKWAQTVDGYSILRNSKGVFEYAVLDSKGDLIPSGMKAKNLNERKDADNQLLKKLSKGLHYSNSQIGLMKSISSMTQKLSLQPIPTTGNIKVVCILIGFTDKAITKTQSEFNNLFNQVGYAPSGSVHDFYLENSYNKLNISFTVVGPYVASQNMAYYGANDANGDDVKPRELVTEAVTLANTDVNFANFDNNNDGYVDCVYVIHAGYGEEAGASANTIWSHAWAITPKLLDGKYACEYTCSPELGGSSGTTTTKIGVICHEFGHVLGSPDFYDVNYSESGGDFIGTGSWDVMADGSWNNNGATPAHHNPFTKIYVYNWATATVVTSSNTFTLTNAEQNSNSFYRINTSTADEYFLLENRQKQMFDSNIAGHGLLIYHVDQPYIISNLDTINTSKHQGLYPICASAITNPSSTVNSFGDINSAGCTFPGLFAKTSFTDNTTPSMKSWAGANTNKSITNITENTTNKTVSFTVTATTGVNEEAVLAYKLKQNYPNPFNNSTNIDFSLDSPARVSLIVFNSLGQEVNVLVNDFLFTGDYSYTWKPGNIASGIYFYQLNVDGNKEVKRMVKK